MMSLLLESTNNIALFGGAFDPWTLGHEKICLAVIEETGFDIWAMPCYKHNFDKNPSDASHRWNMLKLVNQHNPKIIPIDWEIKNKHNGKFIESLNAIKEQYGVEPHIVIGMDNANRIREWYNWQKLITENPFIVMSRGGYEAEYGSLWTKESPHRVIELKNSISSTDVRNFIKNKQYEKAKSIINSFIWNYIVENQLYGYTE